MSRRLACMLLLAPLLLFGCSVQLLSFSVPAQAGAGSTVLVVISANVWGTTGGDAGCVLQVPNSWGFLGAANDLNRPMTRDDPALLAQYVAEPGHYRLGLSGPGVSGGGSIPTAITLTVAISVPASALGQFTMKLSLAASGVTGGPWQIWEPAGIGQFAAITAAPYVRTITVTPDPPDFMLDGAGLPLVAPSTLSGGWQGVAFGDVDGDGRDDLVATDAGGGTGTRCWLSQPGTTWVSSGTGLPSSMGYDAGIAVGHFDGDGLLDFVDGMGRVFFGNGGTFWTQGAALPLTGSFPMFSSIAVGDVNGDGFDDIALGTSGADLLQVLLSNGNRTFRNSSGGLPQGLRGDGGGRPILADLDGDGDLDLLWPHTQSPNLWLGDGQGHWTQGSGLPPMAAAAVGDLTGDGIPEIIVGRGGSLRGMSIFVHQSGAVWSVVPGNFGLPSDGIWTAIALFDFDRDGRLDLVAGRSDGFAELWHNAATAFVPETSSGLPPYPGSKVEDIAVGDFDDNTFPDLAVAISPGQTSSVSGLLVLQNRRTGAAPFGTGCGGIGIAAPQLVAVGLPQRGNASFAMQVQTPTPGALAQFWFGGSKTFAPPFALPLDGTPFGAPGCTLLASPDYTFFGFVDGGGNYTVPLPVPTDPLFAFQTAFAQGAVFAPSANAFGAVFTRAMALRVQ